MTTVLGIGSMETLVALTAITGGVSGVFSCGGYRSSIYFKYTKGDEATVAYKVEFSEDGVTFVRDPRYDVTVTGSKNVRVVVEPCLLNYKYAKITFTPNTGGTGTVVAYARRLDTYSPFVVTEGLAAPPASVVAAGEDVPSGVAVPDASLFIGRWGNVIGSSAAPVNVPETTPDTTTTGTAQKARADNASVEVKYVKGAETSITVLVDFPLGSDWYEYSRTAYTASGTYHNVLRGVAPWEQSFRVRAFKTGTGTGTLWARVQAHLPHIFS
jgi:hypothetical protein